MIHQCQTMKSEGYAIGNNNGLNSICIFFFVFENLKVVRRPYLFINTSSMNNLTADLHLQI